MFVELDSILNEDKTTLLITAAREGDGMMRLTVTPVRRATEDDEDEQDERNRALRQPFSVTATPAELDAELPGALKQFCARRTGVSAALEQLDVELKQAEDDKRGKVSKAKGEKPAPKEPTPVELAEARLKELKALRTQPKTDGATPAAV